jgi:hypothetical protein
LALVKLGIDWLLLDGMIETGFVERFVGGLGLLIVEKS